jgi:cytoplasmic iron level regulating protein YaaA (DUF328/UPF0246 family)
MRWYNKVTGSAAGDYSALAEALAWYDDQYYRGLDDLKLDGKNLNDMEARIGGLMAYYYGIQSEIDGIHQWLEVRYTKVLQKARKGFLEHYNKQLSDRTAQQYAEADDDVLDIRLLINEVALRNRNIQGITKGLEFNHFQLSNLTKLRVAGIEDATI